MNQLLTAESDLLRSLRVEENPRTRGLFSSFLRRTQETGTVWLWTVESLHFAHASALSGAFPFSREKVSQAKRGAAKRRRHQDQPDRRGRFRGLAVARETSNV